MTRYEVCRALSVDPAIPDGILADLVEERGTEEQRRDLWMPRRCIIEHDECPDFSWLEDDSYDPSSPEFVGPVYPSEDDFLNETNAYDPDWYRDPDNHVALCLMVEEWDGRRWVPVESIGNIDFLDGLGDWRTGEFHRLSEIPDGYLRELARDGGLTDLDIPYPEEDKP